MCKSIYFGGPENIMLELSTSADAIDARQWIDPEVVALAGISAAELERYMHPAPEAGKGGAVQQPPYDPAKPNATMPEHMRAVLSWPDEQVTAMLSQNEPPVKIAPAAGSVRDTTDSTADRGRASREPIRRAPAPESRTAKAPRGGAFHEVRSRGLEPPRPIGPQGPQPCASTNSATSARAGEV